MLRARSAPIFDYRQSLRLKARGRKRRFIQYLTPRPEQEAVRRSPENAELLAEAGAFYLRQQQWGQAANRLQQSLERWDDARTPWLSLGTARLRTGDLPAAIHCFQRAATLSGGNAAVRRALGEARAYLAEKAVAGNGSH